MPFYAGERVGVQFDDGLYTAQIVTVHPTGDVDVVYDFDSSIGIFINASLLRHLPKDGVLMSGGSSGSSSFRRGFWDGCASSPRRSFCCGRGRGVRSPAAAAGAPSGGWVGDAADGVGGLGCPSHR